MKERPILFSAPMVRAILNGSKTMTRRVVKLPKWAEPGTLEIDFHDKLMAICRETGCFSDIECPFGISSDRLWVRETFAPHCSSVISNRDVSGLYYRADDETKYETDLSWKPSIFMPRWASRITLEVTGVRVERLQDISEADIASEGVTQRLVSDVIDPIALKSNAAPDHWIGGYDEGFSFCRACADKKIRRLKKDNPGQEYYLDGGWATEGDSQASCETCHRTLDNSFTTYACQSEIDHFRESDWVLNPSDCLSLQNILGSYGWDDDAECSPEDRIGPDIHRLGFQSVWGSINGNSPNCAWSDNPFVWVISFRRFSC